jgi:rifampicin phosphotransferase
MRPQPTPAVPPEIGGWLSHRAIVAREYNVAMIVGTRGLSRVTDGSLL